MPPAGRWRPWKGDKVSKPPAAAGGIRRAATRETGTSVTIDGHPVNLVPLPGLEAGRRDDAGIGGGENAGPGSGEDAGAGIGDDAGAGGGRTDPPGPPPGSEAAGAADGGWRSRLADIL